MISSLMKLLTDQVAVLPLDALELCSSRDQAVARLDALELSHTKKSSKTILIVVKIILMILTKHRLKIEEIN